MMISSPTDVQRLKRIVCKFWKIGNCFKGKNCPYLHLIPEDEICPYYILGFCENGKFCNKYHYRISLSIESLSNNIENSFLPDWYLNWSINHIGIHSKKYYDLPFEKAKTLYDNSSYKSSFFLIKYQDEMLINLSKQHKIWSSSNNNILNLVKAYLNSDNVFILFYSKIEKAFSGYALMTSLPDNFKNSITKKFLTGEMEYHFGLYWLKEKWNKNNSEVNKLLDIDKLNDFEELSSKISCKLIKTLDVFEEIDSEKETASVNSTHKEIESNIIQKYLKIYDTQKKIFRKVNKSSKYSLTKLKDYWSELEKISQLQFFS